MSSILLPIFGGQGGTLPFNLQDSASGQFCALTSFPTGVVLLDACFDAFHAELASLPPQIARKVGICANDFADKGSLLCPIREEHLLNPVVSGSALLLSQVLTFLSHAESESAARNDASSNRLDWLLESNARNRVGVLGFSSGMLAATVVAASRTKLDFIRHAVEAYRLAFWIGVRSQLFRINYHYRTENCQDVRPWTLVISSLDRSVVQKALRSFNATCQLERVFITSVIDDSCVSVSGNPDDLASFKPFLPTGTRICETNIAALYHVPSKLTGVGQELLNDVASRGICFPSFQDLFTPIRSSFDGNAFESLGNQPLVQSIIDMILVQPVNWEAVVNRTVASIPPGSEVEVLAVGVGKTLLKGFEESSLLHYVTSELQCPEEFQKEHDASTPYATQVPVAIVGMSVKTPGAESVDDLWSIISKGLDTLEAIPAERFDSSEMTTNTGNFIKKVGDFDNKFFGISAREAKSMDPQQRMLLHVAYEALENAGYVPDSTPTFSPDEFGCFIGAATHDYVHNLRNDIDIYYSTGTLGAFLSGRLSYFLGFGGPSMVVDTACSSSLVAVYQAVRALMNGDCKAALAGGVNVISCPGTFLGLEKGYFLSPSGGCKPFDASADGYSRAEGCGIFVLKRLRDAIAENDRILGVIRGIEVNQSGKAQSITHPHAMAQKELFRRVLKRSGVKAHAVNFIEAHAPGTQAGDINELLSLRRVFATDRLASNPLYIGSLKANIGHLEAASGAASLAKVLLMLNHKTIPAQISFRCLNPMIPPLHFDNTCISTVNRSWVPPTTKAPRLALVNNFGAAGSNAAMVVGEYISNPTVKRHSTSISSFVFGLSAKDELALGRLRTNLVGWLEGNPNVLLADLSYTLMARRQIFAYRLVVTASTVQELINRLIDATPTRVLPQLQATPVVFVFSGQGAQYHGMGSSLYQSLPLFKKHVDRCDAILRELGFFGIIGIIAGDNQNNNNNNDVDDEPREEEEEEATHSAIFALEYALAMVWISWGIIPMAVVGHSLGEYTALVVSEVLQLRDALMIIATRARLLFERCTRQSTGMLAVALEPDKLQCLLDSSPGPGSQLTIACYNSPKACVVAGPISELTALKRSLEEEFSCPCSLLDLPFAYHSPTMAAIHDDLVLIGSTIKARPPCIPVVSSMFGRLHFPGDDSFCSGDYFAKHCSSPVRFVDAIESFLSCPAFGTANIVWLEIGPHPSLIPMLKSFPSLAGASFVASLHKKQDSWISVSKALASFYLSCTVNWRAVFAQIGPATVLSLPSYPFSVTKYWIPFRENAKPEFTLIENWKQRPNVRNGGVAIFETSTTCLKPYIEGHRVGGVPFCPASIYLELAAAGMSLSSLSHPSRGANNIGVLFEDISFSKPLVLTNVGRENSVRLIVDTVTGAFSIDSEANSISNGALIKHAEGNYQLLDKMHEDFSACLPALDLSLEKLLKPATHTEHLERFSTRTVYDLLFPRVVHYSKDFHTIQSLTVSPDTMEAAAQVHIDKGFQSGCFFIHPLFLDSLLHVPGFLVNFLGSQTDIYICTGISSISFLPGSIDGSVGYTIYTKGTVLPDGMVCESYAVRNGINARALVAVAKGIHFQQVRLKHMTTISSLASLSPGSPGITSISDADLESTVVCIIARNCNISAGDIAQGDELDALGIDSLMRFALRHDLASTFPDIQISHQDLSVCRCVRDLFDLVAQAAAAAKGLSSPGQTTAVSSPSPDLPNATTRQKRNASHRGDEASISDSDFDSLSSPEDTHGFAAQDQLLVNSDHTRRCPSDVEANFLYPRSFPDELGLLSAAEKPNILSGTLYHALGLDRRLWALQTSDSLGSPLILVHDGSGLAASYSHISSLNRRLYGINDPCFLTPQTWSSITQVAQCYANFIRQELDEPVIVGGWSFGGVVAFELAKILQSCSFSVKGVILIDSPDLCYNDHVPLSPELIDYVLTVKAVHPQIQQLCKSHFTASSRLLTRFHNHNQKLPKMTTIPVISLRARDGFNPPNVANVPLWLSNRSSSSGGNSSTRSDSGSRLSGVTLQKTIEIPGNHFSMFDSCNVEVTSNCIREVCNALDGAPLAL